VGSDEKGCSSLQTTPLFRSSSLHMRDRHIFHKLEIDKPVYRVRQEWVNFRQYQASGSNGAREVPAEPEFILAPADRTQHVTFRSSTVMKVTSNSLGLNLGTLPSVPRIYEI